MLLSFVFRVFLTPSVFHTDIISQAGWGQYIYEHGSSNFYQNKVWTFSWPNHPPLTSLHYGWSYHFYRFISLRLHQSVYFFRHHFPLPLPKTYTDFVDKFDKILSPQAPFPVGYLITLKLLPIIGDILIAIIVYFVSSSLLLPSIYLLSPFSWYISSLWGQTDQISFAFILLSFISLSRVSFLSPILFCIGINLKPTSLILVPLYLFLVYKNRDRFLPIITGSLLGIILVLFLFRVFSHQSFPEFVVYTLIPRLADRPDRLTTNAYNFWHIFTLNTPHAPNIVLKLLSYLSFIIINLFSFRQLRQITIKNILLSIFIVSFGGWLFLTNMLDRYSFAGIASALILCHYQPKLLKYWIPLSLIFWLNIYHQWWYPGTLGLLKLVLTFGNSIIGLPLSLANTILYFQIIHTGFKSS